MEERDLVEVDVAVIPGGAFGAGDRFGRLRQEIADVHARRFHEQMHHRRQVHAVGGDHVVVVDIEGERVVVAAPPFDVDRVMRVAQCCGVDAVDRAVIEPHLIFTVGVRPVAVVDGRWVRHDGLGGGVKGPVAPEWARRWHPELVGGLDDQPGAFVPRGGGGDLPPRARLRDVDPVAGAVVQWSELGFQ